MRNRLRKAGSGLMLAAIALLLGSTALAQTRAPKEQPVTKPQDSKVYGSRVPSQAELEADRVVSLAPEVIINILNKEPGLLLQVKKRLVKMAYAQGRLLEESDLTDEALFRFIREDLSIRAMATREIEDRNYIRALPTQQELDQKQLENWRWEQLGRDTSAKSSQPGQPPPLTPEQRVKTSQEDDYWSRHQEDATYIPPIRENPQGTTSEPSEAGPRTRSARGIDRRRESNRSDLEDLGPNDLLPGTIPSQRLRTDDLPGVVATAASSSQAAAVGRLGEEDSNDPFAGMGRSARNAMLGRPEDATSPGLSDELSSSYDRGTYGRTNDRSDLRSSRTELTSRDRMKPEPERPAQPEMLRKVNPYADVPSLYDLYSQVSRSHKLERFGNEIFDNSETGDNVNRLPMDVPVGPEYVIGPGDGLTIQMWGSSSRTMRAVVNSQGQVSLPEVGTVLVAGHSLGDVAQRIQTSLRSQFRDVNADVSLARLRAVRVYVVGEVRNPGAYEVSGLSTPLNAINEAGGPTAQGSLRHIRHMRGKQVIDEYDAYNLILHGVNADVKPLQPGDSIVVGEIGPQVTVEGMVRRPAIYELRGETTLAEILQLAGGVMSTGTLRHIDIERLEAHQNRTMTSIDIPEGNNDAAVNQKLAEFKVRDGDQVRIAPIVPYAEKTVYLDGHLFHPGKYAWREGMKVSDVIKAYTDLLPEPYMQHAEIIRLNTPSFQPVVISFNLADALEKKDGDLALRPFDTVRVFGRFDFEDAPVVTVSGEVREPGDHRTNGVTHVSDAVYLAGGLTPDASTGEAQIYRKTSDARLKVISVDLGKALNGDATQNLALQPRDRVIVHKDQAKVDPPTVKVEGEVGKPGKYTLAAGMTASQLVELAGGLKRSADRQSADLARFTGEDKSESNHQTVELAKAMSGDRDADVVLKDGDVLGVRQITGWADRGATITLRGEVVHPGTYGIREGERLSSIVERAGGFRSDAYPYGAVLLREQVRDLESRNRIEMISRVTSSGDVLRGMTGDDSRDPQWRFTRDAAIAQWQAALDKLRLTPPLGRMVLHINSDIKHWSNSASDIEARAGDVLTIPKKPNFVMVMGAVYNPSAVSYRPGKSAEWYLTQGGGPTQMAKKSAMFVIHADGSVSGTSSTLLGGGLRGISVKPGDTVMVPERAIAGPSPWQTIFQGVQAFSSLGIAASVLSNSLP